MDLSLTFPVVRAVDLHVGSRVGDAQPLVVLVLLPLQHVWVGGVPARGPAVRCQHTNVSPHRILVHMILPIADTTWIRTAQDQIYGIRYE